MYTKGKNNMWMMTCIHGRYVDRKHHRHDEARKLRTKYCTRLARKVRKGRKGRYGSRAQSHHHPPRSHSQQWPNRVHTPVQSPRAPDRASASIELHPRRDVVVAPTTLWMDFAGAGWSLVDAAPAVVDVGGFVDGPVLDSRHQRRFGRPRSTKTQRRRPRERLTWHSPVFEQYPSVRRKRGAR